MEADATVRCGHGVDVRVRVVMEMGLGLTLVQRVEDGELFAVQKESVALDEGEE